MLNTEEISKKTKEIEDAINFGAFHRADIQKGTTLFHYTKLDSFKGIIENKCFWATEYKYLNDEDEFSYVNKILKEVLTEQIDSLPSHKEFEPFITAINECMLGELVKDYYIVSFSLNPDNLTLWAEFSNPGCNIEFSPESLVADNIYDMCEVIYDKEHQKNMVKEAIDIVLRHFYPERKNKKNLFNYLDGVSEQHQKLIAYPCAKLVALNGMAMKSPLFAAEKEYRAIYRCKNNEDVRYRLARNMFVPYMIENITGDDNFVKSVKLAPLNRTDLDIKAIDGFLKAHGMDNTKIGVSEIVLKF